GHALISASWSSTLVLWNLKTGQPVFTYDKNPAEMGGFMVLAPDGRTLVYPVRVRERSSINKLVLLETSSGGRRGELSDLPEGFFTKVGAFNHALAFSPDSRLVVVAFKAQGLGHHLGLWDMATGKMRRLEESFAGGASTAAFTADGRVLAVAGPEF